MVSAEIVNEIGRAMGRAEGTFNIKPLNTIMGLSATCFAVENHKKERFGIYDITRHTWVD
jgi:hypothetical protein